LYTTVNTRHARTLSNRNTVGYTQRML